MGSLRKAIGKNGFCVSEGLYSPVLKLVMELCAGTTYCLSHTVTDFLGYLCEWGIRIDGGNFVEQTSFTHGSSFTFLSFQELIHH